MLRSFGSRSLPSVYAPALGIIPFVRRKADGKALARKCARSDDGGKQLALVHCGQQYAADRRVRAHAPGRAAAVDIVQSPSVLRAPVRAEFLRETDNFAYGRAGHPYGRDLSRAEQRHDVFLPLRSAGGEEFAGPVNESAVIRIEDDPVYRFEADGRVVNIDKLN